MATVTVLGASGTITVPFKSQINASLAQQLASQISAAITANTLYASPYNTTPLPALPTVVGGASMGEQVIGDNLPSIVGSTDISGTTGYPALIINTANAVTVTGVAQTAPTSLIGGEGGLTFYGASATGGGSILLGGGTNLISGSPTASAAPDSTNGGLVGNWLISTGGDNSDSDLIRLASGSDTLMLGANDTVATGGANVLISVPNTDAITPPADPTVFLGSGSVTYFGGTEGNDLILGGGTTGSDLVVLGRGGNSTVVAGTGNSTLIGGGDGDLLFGDTSGAQQQLFGSGAETLLGGGTSSDTFFGFSGISSTGNVFMTAANGTGNNQFWAGAGNDTMWVGMGSDTVLLFADHTSTSGTPGSDVVYGWNANSTAWVAGYTSATLTAAGGSSVLTLSDGTTVTFAGVSPDAIKTIGDPVTKLS